MQRVVVHGQEAEQMIVCLGDRLRRPVLVRGAHLELLEVAPVAVRPGGLAAGLVGGELVLAGLGVAHAPSPLRWGSAVCPSIPSKSAPTPSTRASAPGRPAIWAEAGRPSSASPQGIASAGAPIALNGYVNCVTRPRKTTSPMPTGGATMGRVGVMRASR